MHLQLFSNSFIKNFASKKISRSITINTISKNENRRSVLLDGVRTPFCLQGTSYIDSDAYELAATAMKGVAERNKISKDVIDCCFFGCTLQDPSNTNIARDALLHAGYPVSTPAYTISMGTASSLTSLARAVDSIQSGSNDTVLVGGVGFLSDPPLYAKKNLRRTLVQFNNHKNKLTALTDFLAHPADLYEFEQPMLSEHSTNSNMINECVEFAKMCGIDKFDADRHAIRSIKKGSVARKSKQLSDVISVYLKSGGIVREDNVFSEDTTHYDLQIYVAERSPSDQNSLSDFKHHRVYSDKSFIEGHMISYLNSSPFADGASAMIVMEESKASSLNIKPRAFIKDYIICGLSPKTQLMFGEYSSMSKLLMRNKLTFDDIGVIEQLELFGAYLPCFTKKIRDETFIKFFMDPNYKLGEFDAEKVNSWGGSLGLGNTFSGNGTRLVTTAVNRMHADNSKYALVSSLTDGGMAISILLEKY